MADIPEIVNRQRAFFQTGVTLPVEYRLTALRKLVETIDRYEGEIISALKTDLGKSPSESYMCEIGMIKQELSYMLKRTPGYARDKKVRPPSFHSLPEASSVRCHSELFS